ncbi:MAG: alpha/beta fold hydrolase [Bacteroidota bacterium]|nr:alpha/beta fold hydrolase [Bacteroidota bacterium]
MSFKSVAVLTCKPFWAGFSILSFVLLFLLLPGCVREEKIAAINAEQIPLRDKVVTGYVTGKDGVQLYIRIEGTGTPTIVLPGGPGYSFDYLAPVLSPLDSLAQFIFLDPRGCGRSQGFRNPDMYNLKEMVADVESVRSVLRIQQLDIIGHETGGMLAQEYAVRYPQHVNKMIIMSAPARVPDDFNVWLNQMRDFMPRQITAIVKSYEQDSLIIGDRYNPGYDDAVMKGLLIPNYFSSPYAVPQNFSLPERSWPVFFAMWGRNGYFDITGNLKDFDTRDDLKTLNVKTLALVGQNDYISRFVMEALVESIPKAKLYEFENTGHEFFIEHKDEFLKVVSEFMEK